MRAVLDTNVLVSAYLEPSGGPARILRNFRQHGFILVLSEAILVEFQEVMAYDRLRRVHLLSDVEISAIVANIREFASLVAPVERLSVVPDDPDDDKILEAAVAGEAAFVVSGDRHLLQLRTYRGIRIVTPAVFSTLVG